MTATEEFKAGMARSVDQYIKGQVETFDNIKAFLYDLHLPD